MGSVLTAMAFIFVPHLRLRMHNDGRFGTPRLVPLLCTKEVEPVEEGIEESLVLRLSRGLW
jgi:hypothetical protein